MLLYIKIPKDHPHDEKCRTYWAECRIAQQEAVKYIHKYEPKILSNDIATDGVYVYLRNTKYVRMLVPRRDWLYDEPPWLKLGNHKGLGFWWRKHRKENVPPMIRPDIIRESGINFDSRIATSYFLYNDSIYAELYLMNGVVKPLKDVEFIRTSQFYTIVETIQDSKISVPAIVTDGFSKIRHYIPEQFMPWLHS